METTTTKKERIMAALFQVNSGLNDSDIHWAASCLPNLDEEGNTVPFSILGHVKVDHDADNLFDALGLKKEGMKVLTDKMFPESLIEKLKEGGDFELTPSQDLERLCKDVSPSEILMLVSIAYMDMRRKLESAQIQNKIMSKLKETLEGLRDDLEEKKE